MYRSIIMKKKRFWESKKLNQMNEEEWESLCDRCGKCCVIKLIDEDTNFLHYTNVSCHLFDKEKCHCKDYNNRKKIVKDRVELSVDNLEVIKWLPETCSYKLLSEGKNLPNWHPLIQGNRNLMEKENNSVKGRVISENSIDKENIKDYLFNWNKEINKYE